MTFYKMYLLTELKVSSPLMTGDLKDKQAALFPAPASELAPQGPVSSPMTSEVCGFKVTSVVSNFVIFTDYSPPSSSVHGILQSRILEQVAISFSRGIFLTQGSNLLCISWIARQILYHCSNWEDHKNIYIYTHTHIYKISYLLNLFVFFKTLCFKSNFRFKTKFRGICIDFPYTLYIYTCIC